MSDRKENAKTPAGASVMKAASSLVRNDTVPTRSAGTSGRLIACMEAAWRYSSSMLAMPARGARALIVIAATMWAAPPECCERYGCADPHRSDLPGSTFEFVLKGRQAARIVPIRDAYQQPRQHIAGPIPFHLTLQRSVRACPQSKRVRTTPRFRPISFKADQRPVERDQ